jgi:hypothetical protein
MSMLRNQLVWAKKKGFAQSSEQRASYMQFMYLNEDARKRALNNAMQKVWHPKN